MKAKQETLDAMGDRLLNIRRTAFETYVKLDSDHYSLDNLKHDLNQMQNDLIKIVVEINR